MYFFKWSLPNRFKFSGKRWKQRFKMEVLKETFLCVGVAAIGAYFLTPIFPMMKKMYNVQIFHKIILPSLKSEFRMKKLYFTNWVLNRIRVYFIYIDYFILKSNWFYRIFRPPKYPFLRIIRILVTQNQCRMLFVCLPFYLGLGFFCRPLDARLALYLKDMLNSQAPITPIQDDI